MYTLSGNLKQSAKQKSRPTKGGVTGRCENYTARSFVIFTPHPITLGRLNQGECEGQGGIWKMHTKF